MKNFPSPGAHKLPRILFVASTGGHLAQLFRLADTFGASPDSLWITFDTEQSRSLLKGRNVLHVPYVASRDFKGVLRTFTLVRKALRHERFDRAVSTGAAVTLGVFPWAALKRIPRLYIESVSRTDGPSATGRILQLLRLAELRNQHPEWAGGPWKSHPSVLTQFGRVPRTNHLPGQQPPQLFVTLGTIRPYRFDAMVDGILQTGLANERTTWQIGETIRTDLPGTVHAQMTSEEFAAAVLQADVVVTHSGVGTILQLLETGVYPVVVPRRRSRREHVDDHQTQIARLVEKANIAAVVEAPNISREILLEAQNWSVSARSN